MRALLWATLLATTCAASLCAAEELEALKAKADTDPDAAHAVGVAYLWGSGGAVRNFANAHTWLNRAIKLGHAESLSTLGFAYEKGFGVTIDFIASCALYEQAATLGVPVAQFNTAVCYEDGRSFRKDLETALSWYRKAAAQDYESAKTRLVKLEG